MRCFFLDLPKGFPGESEGRRGYGEFLKGVASVARDM
jgi:hypothetical protein